MFRITTYQRGDRIGLVAARKEVIARDRYICKLCGKKGKAEMIVHHIIPCRNGEQHNPDFMMMVCRSCNYRISEPYNHGIARWRFEKYHRFYEHYADVVARRLKTEVYWTKNALDRYFIRV